MMRRKEFSETYNKLVDKSHLNIFYDHFYLQFKRSRFEKVT